MHSCENLQAEVHLTACFVMFLAMSLLKQHLCLSSTFVVVRKHLCWEGGGFQILGSQLQRAFSLMVADVPETFKDQFCVVAGVTHQGPGWRRSVQNFQIETEKLVCGGKEKWAKEQSSHRKKNVSFSYCFVSVVDGGHSLNLLWESFHDVHHQIICCTLYTYAMLCVHCISATPEGKKKQNKDARGFPVMRALCCWTLTCDELKDLGQYLSRTKASGIRKTEFRWSSMSDFTDY